MLQSRRTINQRVENVLSILLHQVGDVAENATAERSVQHSTEFDRQGAYHMIARRLGIFD